MHGGADGSGAPRGSKNGNYGRYTKEVAATRRWLGEVTHMLRELKKRSPITTEMTDSSIQGHRTLASVATFFEFDLQEQKPSPRVLSSQLPIA
jgi:hypothetical protein